MHKAIGMAEYQTVSTGIRAADLMVKTADVDIMEAQTVCPGKYIVLICGELSAVRAAVDATKTMYGGKLIDSFVLGNPDESIFPAIYGANAVENKNALGVLETFSAASIIVAADMVSFVESIKKPEEGVINIRKFVENIAEKGKLHNVFFFFGINPETVSPVLGVKIYESFVGYHTGIQLGGQVNNIRYFDFGNVPYMEQSKVQKAGIGMIPVGNEEETGKVVLPLVRG